MRVTDNQRNVLIDVYSRQIESGTEICFYTSQYDYSGNENIYQVCKNSCEEQGVVFAGYGNSRAITGLVKRGILLTTDKGWRYHKVKLNPEFKEEIDLTQG